MQSRHLNIIILICGIIAFILLSVGIFHPHWFKAASPKYHYTVPLFGAIWCHEHVCFSFNAKMNTFFDEPGWLMAGRIIECFSLMVLVGAIAGQCFRLVKETQLIHIMITVMFVTSSILSFIGSFVFVDKFRNITSAYQQHKITDSLTYNTLPIGLILLASLTSCVAGIMSALSNRVVNYRMDAEFNKQRSVR